MSSQGARRSLAIDQLRQFDHWVVWKREHQNGKATKVPFGPLSGLWASVRAPSDWCSYYQAVRIYQEASFDGIGFVFTADDPYAGVDLDDRRDPQSGVIEPWAIGIIGRLNSYSEISPSGAGVKIFLKGVLPSSGRKRDGIELYDRARYFTVTGQHLAGTPDGIEERGEEVLALHDELFGHVASPRWAKGTSHTKSVGAKEQAGSFDQSPISCRPEHDAELLRRAVGGANGDLFRRLWEGRWQGSYPSQSEADLALCGMLAFWTHRDLVAMDRLFRRSAQLRRKWDESRGQLTYGELTIQKALASF
jgi:primase-polymerase (primpol)-like protein